MPPHVDVVVVFRAIPKGVTYAKNHVRQNAIKAEKQYSRLIETLTGAGLKAVGRRGETQGQLLVMVTCPQAVLATLIHYERHSDFLFGLPMAKLPSCASDLDLAPLSRADRLRLVHGFISSTPEEKGLGIIPKRKEWDLVESVMVLHDHDFNDHWIRLWTRHQIASVELEQIRDQFGDSVALYFFFLTAYTRALIFPAVLGAIFYFCGTPYSALYSSLLLLWSIVFVEWWRLQERILAVRWCTRGSWRVEKRRADHIPSFPWWKKETRMAASIPLILLFATILAVILTGIFVLEAFVTELYKGPGHTYVAFAPTIIFSLIVPRLLAMYQKHAKNYTDWENHKHQSSHSGSLSIKIFMLSAVNAYLGLALSAFVYVPFGESVMYFVQSYLSTGGHLALALLDKFHVTLNVTSLLGGAADGGVKVGAAASSIWESDTSNARRKLNPSRLQDQMFAFTVTNQVVDNLTEICLPYVLRAVESFRSGKGFRNGNGKGHKKKRVAFDDEPVAQDEHGREEREFLERVRSEVTLPEYDVFADYGEMVTQFGYVALWSTIWPLAPAMALLNNYIEARSDAFKIAVHTRRPIPVRTDTIGPWLECLSFLTWVSALTNSALVYLFRSPAQQEKEPDAMMDANVMHGSGHHRPNGLAGMRVLLVNALLIALLASHVYLVIRAAVRHALRRAIWTGSNEMKEAERVEREVKEKYLGSLPFVRRESVEISERDITSEKDEWASFWAVDEGMSDISKSVKDA